MKKSFNVQIPTTPNFIKVGEQIIDVKDFTESELREIGKLWVERLIANAQKRATNALDSLTT